MFNRSLTAKSSQGKRKRNYGGAGKEKGGGNKPDKLAEALNMVGDVIRGS